MDNLKSAPNPEHLVNKFVNVLMQGDQAKHVSLAQVLAAAKKAVYDTYTLLESDQHAGMQGLSQPWVSEDQPLVNLVLGGVDAGEYFDNDVQIISSVAIEDLQRKLVSTENPVHIPLYPD